MWALVDCDNFFCSCERIFRPDLEGKPVVVLSNNDGCVVARSREVKKMGIKMGMPYYQLKQQLPNNEIHAFSSNYLLYADISNRIMSILRQYAPAVYQYSIDEAMLDLTGIPHHKLKPFGEALAATIRRYVGAPVSIGIASTKTLAKVAVKYAKDYPAFNKCCFISTPEQHQRALQLMTVEDVWGIGRRIASSLQAQNINTAWDFVQKPRQWVKKHYHITGERTWRELRGEDVIDIQEMENTRKSIMTSRSFPEMITDPADLRTCVANFAARCAMKLRRQNSVCATVATFVQSNHFRDDLPQYSSSWQISLPTPTSTTTEIVKAATDILAKIYHKGIHYKRAGVMVSAITPVEYLQPDLFTFNPGQRDKLNSLSQTIDKINHALGPDTVVLATQQYRQTGPDGKHLHFKNAIRRALKSPDYSTNYHSFLIH